MTKYVLDACALIALLNEEEGSSKVAALYEESSNGKAEIVINKVNLLEVYYGYLRENGELFAERQLHAVENSIIKINNIISNELFRQAGKMKGVYKMSLADALAVAQAVILDAVLVTSDHHELDAIDKANVIKLLWIR